MTEAQAVEAIQEAWEAGWEALHPADPNDPDHVPYVFDNEAAPTEATWARVAIVPTVRDQTSLGPPGSRRYEQRGQIAVQLFGPVDAGRGPLVTLADDVRTVLEGKSLGGGVYTEGAATRAIPATGDWDMLVVTVPFAFYEQR